MAADPTKGDALHEGLVEARSHLVDLERHIDRAALNCDILEVGRAWAQATRVEQVLRAMLPPGATDEVATG